MNPNGTLPGSNGGTEQMYNSLMSRLDDEVKSKVNIICSRVRDLDSSKKNILWLHDHWTDTESAHLISAKSRSRFSKIVFVSYTQQAGYRMKLNIPYKDGTVMQNAIVPIEEHEKPTDTINLIYHTTPHRGLEILAPIANYMTEVGIKYHLDVYSSFALYNAQSMDQKYQHVFDSLKSNPNVTYHGYKPNSEIREALKKAHIFAYPSIWEETSCIAAMEAMSAGCQIVCSSLAALPETTSNFAYMYDYTEDKQEHANRFAYSLLNAMNFHFDENNQNKLKLQKLYADTFYSWDLRILQWKELLKDVID